ncbi:activating signal cointegrator 1 complex subunit 1-like [Nasonia vitripennis]|uniref:K Homology domain-containing protein n=1 Tax=Nasonia vitripennis TaxID=7425 RepID=A0A7M7QQK9_NASVI|nr:activating signal cointegrator 1 complex subunit 1-like [Nasonia vitripennis]
MSRLENPVFKNRDVLTFSLRMPVASTLPRRTVRDFKMMDILEPELVWVEGRCYRFCDKFAWSQGKEIASYVEESYEPDYGSNDEESCDASIEIVPSRGNRYKHSFHVNSNFFRFIIGAKGATLKRMAADTNTLISVPKLGQDGDIVITGVSRRDIMAARRRIDILIETSRSKLEFTHFVSIPGNSDEIKENFKKFKDEILRNCSTGVRGLKEEIFQKPERLHLTLIMLVLLDEEDRKKAIEVLEICKEQVVIPTLKKNGPITIEFKGVQIMNDDPSEVEVLYIQAHDTTGCLQKISDDIADYFIDRGLTRRQYDKVKLHMTAMNSQFLKPEIQEYHRKRETFDATNILKVNSTNIMQSSKNLSN